MYYTGVGSKEVPVVYHDLMIQLAQVLSQNNYILRSGGEDGSDTLFEQGCDLVNGKKEIFIPWRGFNGRKSIKIVSAHKAFVIAKKYYPSWTSLNPNTRKMMARISHQVLGNDLKSPSSFVLCYIPNSEIESEIGQAIRIAKDLKIPIFNISRYLDLTKCIDDFIVFLNSVCVG